MDKRMNNTKNYKTPSKDNLIVDHIKDQLEDKMQASAMDINLFCRNGMVHMSGIVDVLSEKIFAGDIARSIDGVSGIDNKITIAMNSNSTDKQMEKEITDRLINSRAEEDISGVGVNVEGGVANLIGNTKTLKNAHIAMSLSSGVPGIKDVVNNIHISTASVYDDATINSHVTQALSITDLSYGDIAHSVNFGKLVLNGYVKNKHEMEIAKEVAMNVEGVTKVINKLKMRK